MIFTVLRSVFGFTLFRILFCRYPLKRGAFRRGLQSRYHEAGGSLLEQYMTANGDSLWIGVMEDKCIRSSASDPICPSTSRFRHIFLSREDLNVRAIKGYRSNRFFSDSTELSTLIQSFVIQKPAKRKIAHQ